MHKLFCNDHFSRREFLKGAAGSLLTAGLAGSSLLTAGCTKKGSERGDDEEVKIGYLPITDATALLIAYSLGYFKDEGLKVARPTMVRSWSSLVEAFSSGKLNLAHLLLPIPVWMRYNLGVSVKIVAWAHTNGSGLTISKDSNIRSFADLGGKLIAVPYWYSMHNVILQLGLRKFGLKPVIKPDSGEIRPDEVNLVILPPPEMPIALASNKIDGYIVAEPFNALGENKIGAKILRFTGDIWKNHPCCTVVMNETLIKERPVFTQKVANAIVRAQYWIRANREETAHILSQEGQNLIPVPKEVLLRVFKGYELERYGAGNSPQAIKHPEWNMNRIDFQPYPFPSATHFIYSEMRNTLVEGDSSFLQRFEPAFVSKDIIEPSFVKNAIDNLGGVSLFPDLNLDSPWTREEVIEL